MKERQSRERLEVLHLGVVGNIPGGMAKVVAEHTSWEYDLCTVGAIKTTGGKRDLRSFVDVPAAALKIGRRHSRRDSTLLVFHLSQGGSFVREGFLLTMASFLGYRCVAFIHGSSFPSFADRAGRLVRFVILRTKLALVLTTDAATALEQLGLNAPKVRVVRNAVTIPQSNDEKTNTIVFAGEVSHRKGADLLFEAWSCLRPTFPDWRLIVAGPVKLDPQHDCPGLSLLGRLPHDGVQQLLSAAKIAVLPSRAEALPMFVLEAMANRCAVVATDVGQVSEMLDGAGVVIQPDQAQIAAALSELMNDENSLAQCAQQSFQRVLDRYSAQTLRFEFENLWLEASTK